MNIGRQRIRSRSLTGAPGGSCYWFRFRTMLLTSFEVGAGRCWPAPTISGFVDLDPESPERLGRGPGPHRVGPARGGGGEAPVIATPEDGLAQDDAISFDGDFQEHGAAPGPSAIWLWLFEMRRRGLNELRHSLARHVCSSLNLIGQLASGDRSGSSV